MVRYGATEAVSPDFAKSPTSYVTLLGLLNLGGVRMYLQLNKVRATACFVV